MNQKFNYANELTASRIIFSVLILFVPIFSVKFFMFYLLGSFTDMIDGTVARVLKQESDFGAKLDTFADFVFVVAVVIKITLNVHIPMWLCIWIMLITLIKITTLISGYVLHHRFLSEHTIMNKSTGILLFFIPITLAMECLPYQALAFECILTCSVSTFAAIQEGYFVNIGKEVL